MSVGLYMDENVDAGITDGLRLRGVDVLTAQEDGYDQTPDPLILDRALGVGRVVVTTDRDFLAEGHRRQATGEPFAGIAYVRQQRVPVGRCVADLEIIATLSDADDVAGEIFFLPL